MLLDEEILEIIEKADSAQDACDKLVDRANEKGGTDNITVVVVCPST
jgi:serine/threonine protein phosphatase PrpC